MPNEKPTASDNVLVVLRGPDGKVKKEVKP